MTPRKRQAERRGRRSEHMAAWWLRLHGWRILASRVRTPRGEVDLVARRGKIIACVEVKWRNRSAALGDAIDRHRLKRVAAAAEIVAPRYAKSGEDVRIDAVLLAPWRLPRHLPNVWHG